MVSVDAPAVLFHYVQYFHALHLLYIPRKKFQEALFQVPRRLQSEATCSHLAAFEAFHSEQHRFAEVGHCTILLDNSDFFFFQLWKRGTSHSINFQLSTISGGHSSIHVTHWAWTRLKLLGSVEILELRCSCSISNVFCATFRYMDLSAVEKYKIHQEISSIHNLC